jgi:hypothetical protein
MNRAMKAYSAKVGDRVACSKNFLRATGQSTNWAAFARGTIVSVEILGPHQLCTIRWEPHAGPRESKVIEANLMRASDVAIESIKF